MGGRVIKKNILFKITLSEQQIFEQKKFLLRVPIFSRVQNKSKFIAQSNTILGGIQMNPLPAFSS